MIGYSSFFLQLTGCKRDGNAKESQGQVIFVPAYLKLHKNGELKKKGERLWARMEACNLCPRECGANRIKGQRGFCHSDAHLEVSGYHPHFGEEEPLVGRGGSGAIFLTNCSLRCVFCINWEVSQEGIGRRIDIENLAHIMLEIQKKGCHNINLVTPTHYSPHILLAIDRAASMGLRLPIVYNTCGWERLDILKELDGVVDIYLPDFKYADGPMAEKYSSGASTYPEITKKAILEMNRQVGVAVPAKDGILYRGLIIRHLVMPNRVAGTKKIMEWIAENLPKDTYVNIMSQYTPVYKAKDYPEIARRITKEEYNEAVEWAKKAGLTRLDIQGYRF
ncbi:MAG: radical SAM protein [Syntrophorhabdaceae bacterium]|nr:radical SAM protein [Syntrophorhabdaceae bacterium]